MMEDETDHETLLALVSHKIHETLSDLYVVLIDRVGQTAADRILVEAMSSNMGNIIGQMDPKKQRKYALQARSSLKEHMLMGAMQKDLHAYGQIGTA